MRPVTSQVRYLPVDEPTDFDEAVTVNSAEELGVSQVTALADGGHLVVWSTLDLDPEFPSMAVFAQRYDASGQKVGGEFQVNTTTGWGNNLRPSVAGFSDGGFVVTWEVYSEDPASPGFDIFGQRFDASGNPVGGEFLVNQSTENRTERLDRARAQRRKFRRDVERLESGLRNLELRHLCAGVCTGCGRGQRGDGRVPCQYGHYRGPINVGNHRRAGDGACGWALRGGVDGA